MIYWNFFNKKNEIRREYEKCLNEVKNQAYFKQQFGLMMKNVSKGISFDVDIADNEEKRIAFTETLRRIYTKRYGNKKVVVKAHTIDGKFKWFMLSNKHNIESTLIWVKIKAIQTHMLTVLSFPLDTSFCFLTWKKITQQNSPFIRSIKKQIKRIMKTLKLMKIIVQPQKGASFHMSTPPKSS